MKFLNVFEKFIPIFLVFQPIIDLFTSLFIRFTELNISIGIIIRGIFFVVAFIYILISLKFRNEIDLKFKKIFILYFLGIFIYSIVYLIFHFINGVSIIDSLMELTKFLYPVFLIFLYTIYFKFNKINGTKISKILLFNMLFYILILLASLVTKTSFYAYGLEKKGFVGWFYSANELGTIIAIIFPISLYFFEVLRKNKWLIYFYQLIVLLMSVAIGTKTIILSILITNFLMIIFSIFYNKKNIAKFAICFVMSFLILIPFYNNINNFYEKNCREVETQKSQNDTLPNSENKQNNSTSNSEVKQDNSLSNVEKKYENGIISKILSNRDANVMRNYDYILNQSIENFVFGIGFAEKSNNFLKVNLIEMDMFDILFRFGIIGFIIIYFPIIYIAVIIIKKLLKLIIKKQFIYEYSYYIIAVTLSLIISFLAGHTIGAPAVSIYFSLIISYLYIKINDLIKNKLLEE